LKQFTTIAIVVIIVLGYFLSFSLSNGKVQYMGQPLNEREKVNATSSDGTVHGQANGTLDNQTMRVTNGTSGTTANGTSVDILTNPLQQQQQSQPALQSPPSLQQQQPLPPVMQPPQEPLYCYYPNYNPQCENGPAISISIVPNAATKLNQAFEPSLLYVNVGTRITWTNYDSQIHTVTSGTTGSSSSGEIFDSGILSPGATFSVTLIQPGIFSYQCTLHPQMVGTVVVV
jgi:plastocyanin